MEAGTRVNSLSRIHELYRGLSSTGKLGVLLVLLALSSRFGGKLVFKNGKIISHLPYFVLPIIQHGSFLQNQFFELFCYCQQRLLPSPAPASPANIEDMKTNILAQQDIAFAESDYERLFMSLPAIKAERLVGKCFDGRMLRTNRSPLDLAEWLFCRPISYLGFGWGKRFLSEYRGDPLLFNWGKKVYVPLPTCGNVSLKDATYKGATSALMSYDNYPWNDHFRVLEMSENNEQHMVLLGAWMIRDNMAGYFTLTYDPSTPVE